MFFAGGSSNARLSSCVFTNREDLHSWLVATAWQLSLEFEPGRSSVSFSTYATTILKRRITDWQRSKYRTKWQFKDRTYERPLPVFVPLDNDESDSLRASLAAWDGDHAAGDDSPFGRLFADRDRLRARDLEAMGVSPNRGTER